MSGLAYGLDKYPDQRAKLEADPSLIPNEVSEVIRWQTPLAHMRRTALADADLFGHQIKKGGKLLIWYLSANRDESVQIGRASSRERVCKYVSISVVAVSIKKKLMEYSK